MQSSEISQAKNIIKKSNQTSTDKNQQINQSENEFKNFSVNFKLQYKTVPGEDLFVVGDIPELGDIEDHRHPLKWTEGHIWVSQQSLVTTQSIFHYKYVLLGPDKQVLNTEQYIDRIADLNILPNQNVQGLPEIKNVDINDEWQKFKIYFTVFYPDVYSDQVIRIHGNIPELSTKDKDSLKQIDNGLIMQKSNRQISWLQQKYGDKIIPFEIQIILDCKQLYELSKDKAHMKINYNYSVVGGPRKEIKWERNQRSLIINDFSSYTGQLSLNNSQFWENTENCSIVNGSIDKADGNFRSEFIFSKIENTGIYIGSFPQTDQDFKDLLKEGITGILNIQTQNELHQQNQQWKDLVQQYSNLEIKTIMNYPIDDLDEKNYAKEIFAATQYLFDMRKNKGLKVFINCKTGISRSPTVAMAFLALYKRVKNWQNVPSIDSLIKQSFRLAHPNLQIVLKIIKENIGFQSKQKDIETEEQEEINRKKKLQEQELNKIQMTEKQLKDAEENLKIQQNEWKQTLDQWKKKAEEQIMKNIAQLRKKIEDEANQRNKELDLEQQKLENSQQQVEQQKIQTEQYIQKLRNKEFKELKNQIQQEEHQLNSVLEIKNNLLNELDQIQKKLKKNQNDEGQKINKMKDEINQCRNLQEDIKEEFENIKDHMEKDAQNEIEKIRDKIEEVQRQIQEQEDSLPQHVIEEEQINIAQIELEQQCDILFQDAPIKFKPRKNNLLDEKIAQIIQKNNFRIPVSQIRDNLYLIGSNRNNCDLKGDNVIVRVGGGSDEFEKYVEFNHRNFERILVVHMINSSQSLEWVVEQLIQDKKIKNGGVYSQLTRQLTSPVRVSSPSRVSLHTPKTVLKNTSINTIDRVNKKQEGISPYLKTGQIPKNGPMNRKSSLTAQRKSSNSQNRLNQQ